MEAAIEKTGVKAKADMLQLPAIWPVDDIKKGQDTIKVNLTSIDGLIHENAVQCLMHAEKHGDTSLMRRLLVDIIDAKSGYRRQGIIAWMRTYTPMELKGDTINLSGVDAATGKKRPWRVQEANANPFRSDRKFAEQAKPIYRDTLLSKVNLMIKEYKAAKANTKDGKPVDASKAYLDVLHADKLEEFMDGVESNVVNLSQYLDNTREVAKARENLAKAQLEMEDAKQSA
jgi:hypothetical protein